MESKGVRKGNSLWQVLLIEIQLFLLLILVKCKSIMIFDPFTQCILFKDKLYMYSKILAKN